MKDWVTHARTDAHYEYSEEQFRTANRVVDSVKHGGGSWLDSAVAYLHLMPEVGIGPTDLWWEGYPVEIVDAVDALTLRPDERMQDYYNRVRADETALFVVYHILDSSPSWMSNLTIRELFFPNSPSVKTR